MWARALSRFLRHVCRHIFRLTPQKPKHIREKGVILGQSGALTFEAIKWLVDQNIMVTFLDSDGNPLTRIMPEKDNHVSGIVKRRQATASNIINMKISTWLLSEKLQEQRKMLNWLQEHFRCADWWSSERNKRITQAVSISQDREKMLTSSLNPDSQRVLEAQAAASYWHCFEGIPQGKENTCKLAGYRQ